MVAVIPSDHITFDADTAWLVCPNAYTDDDDQDWMHLAFWHASGRPCDTCDGAQADWEAAYETNTMMPCPANCIGGRHTFDIEVECQCPYPCDSVRTYRVSIVPGMVLPIRQWDDPPVGVSTWVSMDQGHPPQNLPPAAKPGMWAVQLRTDRAVSDGAT